MSSRRDRPEMDPAAVQVALAQAHRWQLHHVRRTRSTNDDLARATGGLHCDGTVLVTEEQTAGRGRSGRQWSCPAGAGLMFSVRVSAAEIPPIRRAWTGAALGLAIVRGFHAVAGVEAGLKWPNDVLVGGLKCGGILAESIGDSVVVGAGLNISLGHDELPRADATSLRLAGAAAVDRNTMLAVILDEFGDLLDRWRQAGGDVDVSGLRADYLAACATVGSTVRLELPGGRTVTGTAVDVDPDGAVVLDGADGLRVRYSAGDVVHLRPTPAAEVG